MTNFRRKGQDISRVPFQADGKYVNYSVTRDELYELYKNHPLNYKLTDGQRATITGEAEAQTHDSGGTGTASEGMGRGSQGNVGGHEEGDLSKNTINDGKQGLLQGNSKRLPETAPSEVLQGTEEGRGSGRSSSVSGEKLPGTDGTQQQSAGREGSVLPGHADLLEPALVEFNGEDNDVNISKQVIFKIINMVKLKTQKSK